MLALLDDEWLLGGNWIPLMSCTKIFECKNLAGYQTAQSHIFKIKYVFQKNNRLSVPTKKLKMDCNANFKI